MHASSLENMRRCYERYIARSPLAIADEVTVLDLGGADENGNYREVFSEPRFKYVVADISDDASVDVHLSDPHRVPLSDGSVDVVISGQMLEHCEFFWLVFAEMVRLLKPAGFLFLIAPSAGPVHRYPVDCYRFHPDAYAALAKHAGCVLVEVWRDERGPWHDLVGVFRRKDAPALPPAAQGAKVAAKPQVLPEYRDRDAPEERVSGGPTYLEVLKSIHAGLAPRLYLEIGVRKGKSLALASCPAIAVDPQPALAAPLRPDVRLFETTSDRFFEEDARGALGRAPDLAFIDGMHLFEFALRDFMNVERHAAPTTVIVFDDVFPNHPDQGARARTTRVWTGDVWKLAECLAQRRPDLLLLPIDCSPTGLLVVIGADRSNRVLWEDYNPIVRKYAMEDVAPPQAVLRRDGTIAAESAAGNAAIGAAMRIVAEARASATALEPGALSLAARVRSAIAR